MKMNISNLLTIIGALLALFWGVSHLVPTKNVVKGFGELSEDNKNIIRMEWINEGVTLIFLGLLLLGTIIVTGGVVFYVSMMSAVMLVVLAIISLFTGFRVDFFPFKLCPAIFALSAFLIGLDLVI